MGGLAPDGVFAPYSGSIIRCPAMNEPEKAVSWMTSRNLVSEDRKVDMYLRAGLARVDNLFQKTRRLINPLERPLETVSGRAVWYGYAPYNPAMIQIYLTIFRA